MAEGSAAQREASDWWPLFHALFAVRPRSQLLFFIAAIVALASVSSAQETITVSMAKLTSDCRRLSGTLKQFPDGDWRCVLGKNAEEVIRRENCRRHGSKLPGCKEIARKQKEPPTKVPSANTDTALKPRPVAPLQDTSPSSISPSTPLAGAVGHRVALAIGNASYLTVPKLRNPRNDAGDVAAALRAAGFAEVIEHHDLGVRDMQKVLQSFEEKAVGADWAVVYFAGHGIEVDGRNYLIPVDAELKRASDVEDETLALDRVLARVSVARKLQLVILDACRDNPFASRMVQLGSIVRSVGARGLGRIELMHPNLYVAYAARHGELALDGGGKNSPYAKALISHLAEPGLELGIFFRRVRAQVLAETSGKQRPFEYGSLTDENLFFRPATK